MSNAGRTSIGRWSLVVALALVLAASAAHPQAVPTRIGVLLDGPSTYTRSVLAEFEREIAEFFGADVAIVFPAHLVREGDWTAPGAQAGLDGLFADPDVAVILALGPIGSHELARRTVVPKPAIAALVVDAAIQQLPVRDGVSGVHNLAYVDVAYSAARSLELFHELVPFDTLGVLIHGGVLQAIPQLAVFAEREARDAGVALQFLPVAASAAEVLGTLPASLDAVYLAPLEQLPEAGLDSLISGLVARRLATLAYAGRNEVDRGAMASYAPKDDITRRARRVAGLLQRIRDGADAGTLPVALATVSQLTLNMATARAIGYSPPWHVLTEAELLHEQPPAEGPTWTLGGIAHEVLRASLELQIAERELAASHQEVRGERGPLLPQVQASAGGTLVRSQTAAASFGSQAEREGQAQFVLSQTLIDDQTWANYAVARHREAGTSAERQRTELDIVLDAVTGYLNVLRAKVLAAVERANVRTTRSNLELAELRQRTGAATASDVYRWQAELAQGRRAVLDADARVQVAQLELNRVLNRPLEEPFQTAEATVADPELLASEPRLLTYFANAETFRVFRDFTVAEGVAASPELRGLEAAIAAQSRAHTAAGRSFWLPTVDLQGWARDVFWRGGAGSAPPQLGGMALLAQPGFTWGLRLQATLPVFTGLRRSAARARTDLELEALTLQRRAAERDVAARIRASMFTAAASWAGIEQARLAAAAARQNLELVTDAYSRGAVPIITLLDAQQAAVSAGEAAANAVYDFLVDLMRVQRAVGQFDFFRDPEERDAYFRRLDDFYRAAGVTPARN